MRWEVPDERRDTRKTDGRIDKLELDLYFGSGPHNPSITTRLSLLEDAMAKLNANLNKLVWLVVSVLVAAIINLALHVTGK